MFGQPGELQGDAPSTINLGCEKHAFTSLEGVVDAFTWCRTIFIQLEA